MPLCSHQEVLIAPTRKYHCVPTRKYCFALGPANHELKLGSEQKSLLIKNKLCICVSVSISVCVCTPMCRCTCIMAGTWRSEGNLDLSWPSTELLFMNPCELQASHCIGFQGLCLPSHLTAEALDHRGIRTQVLTPVRQALCLLSCLPSPPFTLALTGITYGNRNPTNVLSSPAVLFPIRW